MPDVHHLSQATHDRLSAELEELTTTGRIDIARKIQAARELGDLSENGDYHAAKEEQGKMEARIRDIEALLLDAEIIEAADTDEVSPGHVVQIRYEGDDDAERYLIGSIEEKGAEVEVLTPGSPLGQALLGSSVGDWVEFESPTGAKLKVEVVEIEA
jgi:transcription elongation factor GreA